MYEGMGHEDCFVVIVTIYIILCVKPACLLCEPLKGISEQVRRLLWRPLEPVLPVHLRDSKPGPITRRPFEVAFQRISTFRTC